MFKGKQNALNFDGSVLFFMRKTSPHLQPHVWFDDFFSQFVMSHAARLRHKMGVVVTVCQGVSTKIHRTRTNVSCIAASLAPVRDHARFMRGNSELKVCKPRS